MGAGAPMPRWYDIPVLWLGLQAIVLAAFVGLVRWRWPELSDSSAMLVGGALVLTVIGAALLKRSLIERDEARRTSP